jgi:hypothetical protein
MTGTKEGDEKKAAEKKEADDTQKKRKVPTLRRPGEKAPPQH